MALEANRGASNVKKNRGVNFCAADLYAIHELIEDFSGADLKVIIRKAIRRGYNRTTIKKYLLVPEALNTAFHKKAVAELLEAAYVEVSRLLLLQPARIVEFVGSHLAMRRKFITKQGQRGVKVPVRNTYRLAKWPFVKDGTTVRELDKALDCIAASNAIREPDGSVALHAIPVTWFECKNLYQVGRPMKATKQKSWILIIAQRKLPLDTMRVSVIPDGKSNEERAAIFREVLKDFDENVTIRLITEELDKKAVPTALPLELATACFSNPIVLDPPTRGKRGLIIPWTFKSHEEVVEEIEKKFTERNSLIHVHPTVSF